MMQTEDKVQFKDFFSAHKEAQHRRANLADDGIVVRVEVSPYGGYRIRMIPIATLIGSGHLSSHLLSRGAPKYPKD